MKNIDRRSVFALGIGAAAPLALSSKAAAHHLDERNVVMFGATGDGMTDDTEAIQAAIDDAEADGGGVVRIPTGKYLVTSGIRGKAGVHIVGDGIGATVVKRADFTAGMHIFGFTAISHFSIRELTLDGNWIYNTTPGHGIRTSDVSEFYIGNVRIEDARSYGIGCQGDFSHKRSIIENVWIASSGADGIDLKNRGNSNEGIIISNVTVVDPGMLFPEQAGIDLRGPCILDNIVILLKTVTTNVNGIRFRETGVNGIGAEYSSLNSFYIRADKSVSETVGSGVVIVAPNVSIANGHVSGTATAVGVLSEQCCLSNITANSCRHSGFVDSATDTAWIACKAYNNGGSGFRLNSCLRTQLIACEAVGNAQGFRMLNRAAGAILVACRSSGNEEDWRMHASWHVIGAQNYPYSLPLANGMGVRQAYLGTTKDPVNFLMLDGGAKAANPVLSAQGADRNIDITLLPKGSGRLRFGPVRGIRNATITGYMEVKDLQGNIRKLAVVS